MDITTFNKAKEIKSQMTALEASLSAINEQDWGALTPILKSEKDFIYGALRAVITEKLTLLATEFDKL